VAYEEFKEMFLDWLPEAYPLPDQTTPTPTGDPTPTPTGNSGNITSTSTVVEDDGSGFPWWLAVLAGGAAATGSYVAYKRNGDSEEIVESEGVEDED
jgi:hypothetical protein